MLMVFLSSGAQAQEEKEKKSVDYPVSEYRPLTLKLTDDGAKYIRFIIWNQFWLRTNDLSAEDADLRVNPRLRRTRVLMFSQISPRFLIMTHFGANSEFASGLHPLGESDQVSLFMHDAWGEYRLLDDKLYAGLGVHYWNGLSRLTSQSTLNMMTLDAPIFNWAQLGLSDQFARHLGGYIKGELGDFNYRVSLNDALPTSLDNFRSAGNPMPTAEQAVYRGAELSPDNGNRLVAQGYFNYELFDSESTKLPYFVGTYLGKKRVLNVGAGFFHHTGGTVTGEMVEEDDVMVLDDGAEFHDVNHFAVDVFYDAPIGANGAALNLLGAFYNYDFGPNYVKSAANPNSHIATGSVSYIQAGYLLPGEGATDRFMPYASFSYATPENFDDPATTLKLGMNYFMNGHNSKLSLEYENLNTPIADQDNSSFLTLQMHIFL